MRRKGMACETAHCIGAPGRSDGESFRGRARTCRWRYSGAGWHRSVRSRDVNAVRRDAETNDFSVEPTGTSTL